MYNTQGHRRIIINTSKPIDIVLVTWNRPKMTELVIKTLAKNTKYPARLIVLDNRSDDNMRKMLDKLKKHGMIQVLRKLPYNYGLEPARNMGLRIVESDYFVCTDSDILPEKPMGDNDWLGRLVNLLDRYPEYVSIAARTQVMIGTGDIFDGNEDKEVVEFSHPGGSLRIMRTAIIKGIGGWRYEVEGRGQEEMYIAGKIREQDYKSGFATDVRCYHMFGTDGNWGYGNILPEDHGHKPVWHPAIINGDDKHEIKKYI